MVGIAERCGIDAAYKDAKLASCNVDPARPELRPADWVEMGAEATPADAKRFYGGRCLDMSLPFGTVQEARRMETDKLKKYKGFIEANGHVAVTVVAFGTESGASEGAMSTVGRWTRCLTKARREEAEPMGRPADEIWAAIGFAFATVMVRQVEDFFTAASVLVERVGRGNGIRRPLPMGATGLRGAILRGTVVEEPVSKRARTGRQPWEQRPSGVNWFRSDGDASPTQGAPMNVDSPRERVAAEATSPMGQQRELALGISPRQVSNVRDRGMEPE